LLAYYACREPRALHSFPTRRSSDLSRPCDSWSRAFLRTWPMYATQDRQIMSGLNFADFFTDVHGYSPLPWQERLARQLIENHAWPDLIDLPTASGKTACIDIALFHLAWCARRREP